MKTLISLEHRFNRFFIQVYQFTPDFRGRYARRMKTLLPFLKRYAVRIISLAAIGWIAGWALFSGDHHWQANSVMPLEHLSGASRR